MLMEDCYDSLSITGGEGGGASAPKLKAASRRSLHRSSSRVGGKKDAKKKAKKSRGRRENRTWKVPNSSAVYATGDLSGNMGADAPQASKMRTTADALCCFEAKETDRNGRVTFDVPVGGRLTSYRVWAVAAAEEHRFGRGEAKITASQPLMVRPSLPRFMNFGDRGMSVSVVLQNQTALPMDRVDVAMRLSSALSHQPGGAGTDTADTAADIVTFIREPTTAAMMTSETRVGEAGFTLALKPHGRKLVTFPVVPLCAGEAVVQIAAVTHYKKNEGEQGEEEGASTSSVLERTFSDCVQQKLPIYTPACSEAFAVYGEVEQDGKAVVQAVQRPRGVHRSFGGLEISTTSTALHQLTDAIMYLKHYEYSCSEQIASKLLSTAALKDVLLAFNAAQQTEDELIVEFADCISTLRSRQQPVTGGFGLYRKLDWDYPYMTVHVAHCMARAHNKGFVVPGPMINAAKRYLKTIKLHTPWPFYSGPARREIRAYALYVRYLFGDEVRKAAVSFFKSNKPSKRELKRIAKRDEDALPQNKLGNKLSACYLGWLLAIIAGDNEHTDPKKTLASTAGDYEDTANEILDLIRTLMIEEERTAYCLTYATPEWRQYLFYAQYRSTGVVLEALIDACPKRARKLIVKMVNHLMLERTRKGRGHWGNTQDNLFVLLALDRYFHVFERDKPKFAARVWLGDRHVSEHIFKGRSLDTKNTLVPMNAVLDTFATSAIRTEVFGPKGVVVGANRIRDGDDRDQEVAGDKANLLAQGEGDNQNDSDDQDKGKTEGKGTKKKKKATASKEKNKTAKGKVDEEGVSDDKKEEGEEEDNETSSAPKKGEKGKKEEERKQPKSPKGGKKHSKKSKKKGNEVPKVEQEEGKEDGDHVQHETPHSTKKKSAIKSPRKVLSKIKSPRKRAHSRADAAVSPPPSATGDTPAGAEGKKGARRKGKKTPRGKPEHENEVEQEHKEKEEPEGDKEQKDTKGKGKAGEQNEQEEDLLNVPRSDDDEDDMNNAQDLFAVTPWDETVQPLLLQKRGVGRLYYRLGLKYAPENLTLDAMDMGFVVTRRYEAVDDPEDVSCEELPSSSLLTEEYDGDSKDKEGAEEGEQEQPPSKKLWKFKLGARVKTIIHFEVRTDKYHVALVDKLPAGLETLNPALKGNAGKVLPPEVKEGDEPSTMTKEEARRMLYGFGHESKETYRQNWFDHQNLRDERAEAFAGFVSTGRYEYSFICRATTAGSFIIPPTKAEEMYSPDVFGRSATEFAIISK